MLLLTLVLSLFSTLFTAGQFLGLFLLLVLGLTKNVVMEFLFLFCHGGLGETRTLAPPVKSRVQWPLCYEPKGISRGLAAAVSISLRPASLPVGYILVSGQDTALPLKYQRRSAESGSRTHMLFRALVFETSVSAISPNRPVSLKSENVLSEGVEPSCLATYPLKGYAYAIPPQERCA